MKREMVQVSKSVRIENGPARVTAVASVRTLSNGVSPKRYQKAKKDAYGKKIKEGEDFTYLDDKGKKAAWLWYLYQIDEEGIYQKVGGYADKVTAFEAGKEIAETIGEDANVLKNLWNKLRRKK